MLIKKFGIWGTLRFIVKIIKTQRRLKKEFGTTIENRFANVPESGITELFMMTSMYLALTEMEHKERAYDFVREIFHKIEPTAHEALYNINGLLQCDGDIYTNFCRLNRSIFENSARKGYYEIAEIRDSKYLQYLHLTKCLNVDAFADLGCPELARLGCDGDIAGYAPEAMGNKVNFDFRRPHTIVRGDGSCEFYYYRKVHAAEDMETH